MHGKTCGYSGKYNAPKVRFCAGCAERLTPTDQTETAEMEPQPSRWFNKLTSYKTDMRLWKRIGLALFGATLFLLLLCKVGKPDAPSMVAVIPDELIAGIHGEARSGEVAAIGLIFTCLIIISAVVAIVASRLIMCAFVIVRTRQHGDKMQAL